MTGLDVYTVPPAGPLGEDVKRRAAVRVVDAVLAAMPDATRAEQRAMLAEVLDCLGLREAAGGVEESA